MILNLIVPIVIITIGAPIVIAFEIFLGSCFLIITIGFIVLLIARAFSDSWF